MNEQKTEKPEHDPFGEMVQLYDTWAKSWAGTMSDMVASKSFAESMGQQLESSLNTLTLVRRQMSELMEQYLEQMNLPTRTAVLSLAERLTHIEMRLDDLDAKADAILDRLETSE